MKITLIRHSNRDISMSSDGGLNEIGKGRAEGLKARLQPEGDLPKPTQLFSSPKRRAKETMQPLSEFLKMPLQITELLDERFADESSVEFRSRVRKFIDLLPEKYKSNEVLYLCTHADWLEEAMTVMPTDLREEISDTVFACCETRTFEFNEGIWEYRK